MAQKRFSLDRNAVIEALRSAAKKLGRPPHRGELTRVAGVSHRAVLKHFASLRDAVRAAGMEPSRQGLKVANRNEYVRQGKYAAGTFYARFGSWGAIAKAASGSAVKVTS